jgi:SAM-dependent methyltransferase
LKEIIKNIIPKKFQPVLKKTILRIWYYGNAFHCPVCLSKIRLLKPCGYNLPVITEYQIVGSGLRNAMCPVCGSFDRVRLLYLFLKFKTNLFTEPVRLLHIAPEKPLSDIFIKHNNINYLTGDINPGQVMEKMDITAIHYPDNTFDAILCNHVLEHIPDDRKAMRELLRVLKPDGWAILQVPISKILEKTYEDFSISSPQDREKHYGQKDHVRIYGTDFTQRLQEAGFKVKEYKWIHDQRQYNSWKKYSLNADEIIFFCTRKI